MKPPNWPFSRLSQPQGLLDQFVLYFWAMLEAWERCKDFGVLNHWNAVGKRISISSWDTLCQVYVNENIHSLNKNVLANLPV